MSTNIKCLRRGCDIIEAGIAMVSAHEKHSTMVPAVDEVSEKFPNVDVDHLECLWIGVNARDRKGLD